MDERTENLRDVFLEVSDTETVTESRTEARGTLVGSDAAVAETDVGELVGEMRERYGFRTDLSRGEYVAIARAFHDGDDDWTIAVDLGLDPETVFHARLDLHLFRDADTDAPFDLAALRGPDDEPGDIGDGTRDRYRRVVAAQDEARGANYRYREAFEAILTDADLEGGYTDRVREDGLREAAEDIETDVSF